MAAKVLKKNKIMACFHYIFKRKRLFFDLD